MALVNVWLQNMKNLNWVLLSSVISIGISGSLYAQQAAQWTTHEIVLKAQKKYENPYTDVDIEVVFFNAAGDTLRRPGFWDGGNVWRVRFAPPEEGAWFWTLTSTTDDEGLQQQGSVASMTYEGDNELIEKGLLKMSPGKRGVVHASGDPFFVVGDTPWAIPFRATKEQVREYAEDRREKGFNTALLMSLQPDMNAVGPNARDTEEGFVRAFDDLADGHINWPNPSYFQYLDDIVKILIDHEIVPVYQPVFHGFGWKGLDVLGNYIEPEEYVRYTRYLLARYGSMPAMWLIAGDNGGDDPGVKEAGEMLESEDAYRQPTGLHYNPCDDYVAEWAVDNPIKHCMHYNKTHQAEEWLDFQWAQTGHSGEHLYHKVERLYDEKPTKASANGEPTYEGMNGGQNGLGWWQGEEAWMQLMSGGTMGVVYGAASLWQWKVSPDEEGWANWAVQPMSWRQAMAMEGSGYVGLVGKILKGLDMTDIEKRWDLADGNPLLMREGELYIAYAANGSQIYVRGVPKGMVFRWVNPKTGEVEAFGKVNDGSFQAPSPEPWVLIIGS